MTIGTELRQAREEKGMSLRELSERTKLRPAVLRAIEADQLEQLPGGIITRGFLKVYAREIGLDPDEIGRRYTTYLESTDADRLTLAAAPAGPHPAGQGAAPDVAPRFTRPGLVIAGVVVALLAVGYLAWRPLSGRGAGPDAEGAPPRRSGAVTDPAASAPADPATGPGGAVRADPARPPAAIPGPTSVEVLRVDLHATAPCWVSALADGEQVVYRLMNAGERQTIHARKEAVLRIGNPANLAVSINDQPVRPFARPGMPVTLRITPANYRDLVVR